MKKFQEESLPKFKRSISCICWAYNEKPLIESFLSRLDDFLSRTIEDYEIVIVDDASTDGTREIIQAMQKKIPRLVLIENEKNMNAGMCMRRAVRAAQKEFLFWQTIDWSYDLQNLRPYLELLKQYDIVTGSRLAQKPSLGFWRKFFSLGHIARRSDTFAKALISMTNYLLIRIFFRVPLTDYQNVSLYPLPVIQAFTYESKSSFTNPEGLIKAYWGGAKIVEVPIGFIPRSEGHGKGTRVKAIWQSVSDIFTLWLRWNRQKLFNAKTRGRIFRLSEKEIEALKLSPVEG